MDEMTRTTCLLLLFSFIKDVDCYQYDILGLVASSTCAVFLFLIVILIGVFAAVWSHIVTKHYQKRGIKKSPRKSTVKKQHGIPARPAAQSDVELQLAAQQRMRPKLPNTWREMRQQNGATNSRENIIASTSFQNEDYYFTGEVLSGSERVPSTVDQQPFTIVTELEDIQTVQHVPNNSANNISSAVYPNHNPPAETRGVNHENFNNYTANVMDMNLRRVSNPHLQEAVRHESSVLEAEKVTQF